MAEPLSDDQRVAVLALLAAALVLGLVLGYLYARARSRGRAQRELQRLEAVRHVELVRTSLQAPGRDHRDLVAADVAILAILWALGDRRSFEPSRMIEWSGHDPMR